jgi:adenine-specific DNA methylase
MEKVTSKSLIEVQFPVAQLSAEAYKERKAGAGQTLTRFGKWWGRKPLILVRALVLGLLLPATDKPQMDRKVLLHLLRMDETGLLQRKNKTIPPSKMLECLSQKERKRWLLPDSTIRPISRDDRAELQAAAFRSLPYRQKLDYCCRPEELDGTTDYDWQLVNGQLHTQASSLRELVDQLGVKRFGHRPQVGDCFCGGGSIPFEAARIGCDAYGADLNPVAALLTWGSITLSSATGKERTVIDAFPDHLYDTVRNKVDAWGIDRNEEGWEAQYYIYCTETVCPECGWRVPMAPSWIISTKQGTVALLRERGMRYDIDIVEHSTERQRKHAEGTATVQDSKFVCPHCHKTTSIEGLRSSKGPLRLWEAGDIRPRLEDVFQDRLYCIAWDDSSTDTQGKTTHTRRYNAPTVADLGREEKAWKLLREHWAQWQRHGIVPTQLIATGEKTDEPKKERGWQYWHQLFTPRQLLLLGTIAEEGRKLAGTDTRLGALGLLMSGRCADWNSRLSRWHESYNKMENTFYNQALNTLWTYGSRSVLALREEIVWHPTPMGSQLRTTVRVADARDTNVDRDLWITDPPYADQVNYDELSEFFLAWDRTELPRLFPNWGADSKRPLAVKGAPDEAPFRDSMVAIYRRLADHMPPNGRQVIMFTHRDASVWADLARILMDTGLQVLSAWNIATETDALGLKSGTYVKGTVCMTLARRTGHATAFTDEVYQQVKQRVTEQLDSMQALDDPDEPCFGDPDYALAAYAATLQVLTQYDRISDLDNVKGLLKRAEAVTYDQLVPRGMERNLWRQLTQRERLYVKGLELEMAGSGSLNAYEALSKAFNVPTYQHYLASTRPNEARVRAPSEWPKRHGDDAATADPLFALLRAIATTSKEGAGKGLHELQDDVISYETHKQQLVKLAQYVVAQEGRLRSGTWLSDLQAAQQLLDAMLNERGY